MTQKTDITINLTRVYFDRKACISSEGEAYVLLLFILHFREFVDEFRQCVWNEIKLVLGIGLPRFPMTLPRIVGIAAASSLRILSTMFKQTALAILTPVVVAQHLKLSMSKARTSNGRQNTANNPLTVLHCK